MKSVRASLIVYVWLLLALGLGAASLYAYSTAADWLRAEQETKRQLLETQFKEREQEERARFDDYLLTKARIVATHVELRNHTPERSSVVRSLVPLSVLPNTQAHVAGLLSWGQYQLRGQASPVSVFSPTTNLTIYRRLNQVVLLDEAALPQDPDGGLAEYFQVDSDAGVRWPAAENDDDPPAFGHGAFDPVKAVGGDWMADDVALPDGRPGRRVQFKSTSTRLRWFSPFGGRRGPSRAGDRPPGDRPPGGDRPAPPPPDRSAPAASSNWIVVHVASETTRRDHAIDAHRRDLRDALEAAEREGQGALADLRRKLLANALVTFLLTTIGGFILVGLGLAPLQRLSDAVSRVSPRDFRLPLDPDRPLPRELAPIGDRLQATLDELRRVFEREKQASADISHELRTPVASLLTTIEVALRKPRSAEEYRTVLDDCRGITRQMRQLVERILALARLDAGSDRLRPRPVEVGELVRECAALVNPLAGERGLDVRVHCPKPVTWTTDPDKLREVLVNLLHNAVEYNKPAGSIDVAAEASDGWLTVEVHDTGVGISKDAFGHIFERFYRADPSRHASELHAGLGLSIVKGYVGLLGGTVTVESEEGRGSTFRVRLPAAAAAA